MARNVPYGNFNFVVEVDGDAVVGGFSDVSGLNSEITIAEYRAGSSAENHVRKIPGMHKFENVTLKRGIVDSAAFWAWMKEVWTSGVAAKRTVRIQMLDEAHNAVQQWVLVGAVPMKYTGPSLAGAGGTEVAMEEWQLSYEAMQFEQVA